MNSMASMQKKRNRWLLTNAEEIENNLKTPMVNLKIKEIKWKEIGKTDLGGMNF